MENKEKVIQEIENILDIRTYLKKQKDGSYQGEIYTDYRDELDDGTIKKIGESEKPLETFYNIFQDSAFDAEMYENNEINRIIKENWNDDEFNYEKYEELIEEWVSQNVYFNFPYDHFLNQDITVNIVVDTGDGNYDFTLNNILGYCATDEINDESAILWLVEQQGYTKTDLINLIENQDFKNSKFLKSVYQECENVCSHMNALTFFTKMTLKDFIEYKENPKDITLPKNTSCGLMDFWSGAGSVLEIELEKSVIIPKKFVEMHIDGCRGYSVKEIYGMCNSFWD